jgi:O-antigen ligase
VFSQNPLLSVKFFLARIWYVVPFVLLPQFFLTTQTLFKKAALLLLLPMAFVVIQCLGRHALTGFSFEGIKQTLSPFFRNHVNYSAMLVCLLAVLWAVKKLTPKSNPYYRWINIGLAVGLVALFFAYSRGAWVALFAGIATVLIIQRKWMTQSIVLASTAFIVLVTWLVADNNYVRFAPDYEHTIFHDDLGAHLQSTTSLKDLSNAERFYRWVAGAKMIAEKPVVGFGPNTFYGNYKNYTVDAFKTYVSNNPEHSSVHNYFLLTALEQGFVGLLLFCALLFKMLMYTQKLYHALHNTFYRTVALTTGVIIVMITAVNLMSDMIETDKIGSLFWLSVGVLIVLSNQLKIERESLA